ncbi:MAG: phosphate-starvation-inducible PsiE family protein [Acidimicrobiales bacterium]
MTEEKQRRLSEPQEHFAHRANRLLIWTEDAVYGVTAFVLGIAAFVVLGKAIYDLVSGAHDGVINAIETSFEALLIVFILVELLTAVRVAVVEHELIAEPFLLVGILAAIKELVALSTFKLHDDDAGETVMKVGVLAGVIIVLAAATWILRRREREPKETNEESSG